MGGTWKRFDDIAVALDKKVDRAIQQGINDTMAESVVQARSNHPGWKTVTGKAEDSLGIRRVEKRGGKYRAGFGSKGVAYFIFLEIGWRFHAADHTIRRAADVVFPRVWTNIRKYL